MDREVAAWRQKGRVFLWRYPGGNPNRYGGWHLSCDSDGCDAMDDALRRMAEASHRCRLDVVVTAQSARPTPPRFPDDLKVKSASRLRLVLDQNDSPDRWTLEWGDGDAAALTMGAAQIGSLRAGITDIRNGRGDYSIGGTDDDQRLWLWWRQEL